MSLDRNTKPGDRLVIPHVRAPGPDYAGPGRVYKKSPFVTRWISEDVQRVWSRNDSLYLYPETTPKRATYKRRDGDRGHFSDEKNPPEFAIYKIEDNELTLVIGDPQDVRMNKGQDTTTTSLGTPARWSWRFVIPNYAKSFDVIDKRRQMFVKLRRVRAPHDLVEQMEALVRPAEAAEDSSQEPGDRGAKAPEPLRGQPDEVDHGRDISLAFEAEAAGERATSDTTELVLSMGSLHYMLDLDTGQTMDPPATARPEQARMDVCPIQMQPYERPTGLRGKSLQGLKVKASDWDTSLSDVRRALASDRKQKLTQMQYDPSETATYFFRTREGTDGILQLLALVEEPKGIRVRYKTFEVVKGSSPAERK